MTELIRETALTTTIKTRFAPSAVRSYELGISEARELQHMHYDASHSLLVMVRHGEKLKTSYPAARLLHKYGLTVDSTINIVRPSIEVMSISEEKNRMRHIAFSPAAHTALNVAIRLAHGAQVLSTHFLIGIVESGSPIVHEVLESHGINQHQLLHQALDAAG